MRVVGAGGVRGLRRHLPFARASLLLVPVVAAVAVVQLARAQAIGPLVPLACLAFVIGVQPLLEAAISRAGETAADAYAASAGVGEDLAAVLSHHGPTCTTSSWAQQIRTGHPTVEEGIARLTSRSQA